MARWLWTNLGSILLALFLAILVWVVAANEENPIQERTLPQPVAIEFVKPDGMILHEPFVDRVEVSILAPLDVWERLNARQVHVVADLTGLLPGTQEVPLAARVEGAAAAKIARVVPDVITVNLENSATRQAPVDLEITGEPAVGYEAETPVVSESFASVSGPASAVGRVSRVEARLALEGLKRDFNGSVTLSPIDPDGNLVSDVTVSPEAVQVRVPVTQKQGFREVAVKVVITGEVAAGYQVTNISVAPAILTVGSGDPRLVQQMPGFVTTQPLDISGATDDIVRPLPLELPAGITAIGQPTVLVQVSIAAIEYSATIARELEMQGLSPGLSATASPDTVDVILLGPLPVLDDLTLQDVRVVLNLQGLGPGTYQVTPEVQLLPPSLRAENVLPGQIEVIISVSTPTPTPTATLPPAAATARAATATAATPTHTPTAAATHTPTAAPTRVPPPTPSPSATAGP
jgi:YbbR domain-containing protein